MNVKIGENFISKQNLYYEDGETPFPVTAIKRLRGKLVQTDAVIKEYTYPGDSLRQGDTSYQIEIEISKVVSAKLSIGPLYLDLYLDKTNPEFELDSTQLIIQRILIAEMS